MTDASALEQAQTETLPAQSPLDAQYRRLTNAAKQRILVLADEELPQNLIAEQLGVHPSTICRFLHDWQDTSTLALRRLKSGAIMSADRVIDIVENGKNEEALKAAKFALAASGVGIGVSGVNVGVQVIIGASGQQGTSAQAIQVQVGDATVAQP